MMVKPYPNAPRAPQAVNPMAGLPGFAPWQSQLGGGLSAVGAGLMAAGGGGWQNFAPAFQQAQANTQAQQSDYFRQNLIRQQFMQEQEDRARQLAKETQSEQEAAAQRAASDAAIDNLVAAGTIKPEVGQMLKATGQTPSYGDLVPKPDKPNWEIKTIREGNQDVTYRINPLTGERERLGAGAAFSPNQAGDGGYGLVPIYTRDPQGNLHAFQPSKGGGMQEIPLPQGQAFAPGVQYLDTGTGYLPVGKRGENVGTPGGPVSVPKDVAGEKAAQAAGELTGKAQVDLPTVTQNAEYLIGVIEQAKTSPGREAATGASSVFNPLALPSSDRSNFLALRDQIKGSGFLQAYNVLKGGGQITEVEGEKATNALIRLQTTQSESEFLKALNEFEDEVKKLVEIAKNKAAGNFTPLPTPNIDATEIPPPPPGFIRLTPP